MAMKIVYFGDRHTESSKIFSSVEYAFDTYRQQLSTFMNGINHLLQKLESTTSSSVSSSFNVVNGQYLADVKKIPEYYERNEIVMRDLIVPSNISFTYAILPDINTVDSTCGLCTTVPDSFTSTVHSYDSIDQVIIHINRDWSKSGEKIRQEFYRDGIIAALTHYRPVESQANLRVLIPGGALGRLAVEVAASGYSVEMNECSGAMLSTFNSITSQLIPNNINQEFYPFVTFPLQDSWSFSERFNPIQIPFYNDSPQIYDFLTSTVDKNNISRLSVQFGEFVRLYSSIDRKSLFDVIITCFFIDTGSDIMEYIGVIKHALRPGGLWINSGPLHYHKKDAIPYSHDQVISLIELSGFRLLTQKVITTSYCGDDLVSMKPEMYIIPLNVFEYSKL